MHQRKLKILTKITRQISPFLDPLNHLCLEGMGHAHSLPFADVSYHVPGNTATINTSDEKNYLFAHLARNCLHDCIEATFRSIEVTGDLCSIDLILQSSATFCVSSFARLQ